MTKLEIRMKLETRMSKQMHKAVPRSSFRGGCISPSPGTPGEGWAEGDFEHQRRAKFRITLTPALSRSTGRGSSVIPTAIFVAVLAICPFLRAEEDEPVPANVRDAVDRALVFLKTSQRPDGAWPAGQASSTAVPSLAVMAFLARGNVPGQGPYGDSLNHTIDFVLSMQRSSGLLSKAEGGNAVMYEHGISSVMLSEVYGMVDDTRRERIEKALAKAVKLTLDAQAVQKAPQYQGGWRYQPGSPDSDISCTGWQLMALRGAANCGAAVPRSALDAGREYVRHSAANGGGFSYQPGGAPNQARSGTGILSMELLGQHDSPEAKAAGDWLLRNPPDNPGMEFYYYAVYYNAQALNQLGGIYWSTLYPKLRDTLLTLQQPNGSFAGGSGQEQEAGDAYRTSMAVLALCVPYRYLPLYQK
jgi:hypothetical protein